MKIKLLFKKPKKLILLLTSLFFLSAIPYYFAGSGLDNPEPMGSYLNGNFPGILPQGLPYEPVFSNISFDSPLTFNELPTGNKVIVGQRDGRIFWFDKTPNVATKNSMLDLSEKVGVVWDGGFLGLALHPEFGTGKNYFYVWYTTEDANSNDFPNSYTTQSCDSEEYWGNFLVLARYEANPTTLSVQESSEQVLLKLRMYGTTHRGGGLLFGDDGFLYLTTGDQTAFKKSQDIVNNLDGGVLRFDVDQDPTKSHPPVRTMPNDHGFSDELTGNGYWIPNDNPFLSPTGGNFEEYYSMGHRNPHRMTKDRETGTLYVGEIGGGRHEEINIIKKGGNFGWPLYEGLYRSTFCVSGLYNNMPHEQPLLAFPRSEANAVIGGYVYRGNEIPELKGKYICADYGSGEEIFTVDINTGQYQQYGNFTSTNIISFGEDKQGELYILKQGTSSLFKVTSKNTGFGNTPQLLSETGAFTDLINLTPADGLIPYDLVESFWSDGALKKRWMAIPNDGSHNTTAEKINYSDVDDWDFPIGSVLVKHFELPLNENNPSVTKRLETRFSVKASDGNFYFVTYKWNDQQTDAVLLTSGLDESIDVVQADGSTVAQTWSYPATIDCVTCHNPTTGGTLGTRARYLNKDFTYSETGRTANQLVTLSHLGILDQNVTDSDTNSILTSKSINDASATLDEKARSYMDLNCAYCHRPGTGNRGDFDLRLNLDLVQTGLLTANPYLPLGIPNEKIVDPGNTATSILYHRVNSTDPAIRMPPIAKNKIDLNAVQLIDDWINQLDPDPCTDRIIMETFTNVPGTTIAELKSNANFPATPSSVDELNEFRIPVNVGDDYGVRVKGLLKAPESGTYYFWVAGDDNVELSLSTDANEVNKTRIAYHNNWSYDGEWNKYSTQKSTGINLVAGQNYYIEALMNERGGGDNLSVGWRKPSNGDGATPFQVIPCTAFDLFNGPPVVNVTGVTLSPETATIDEGTTQQLSATISPTDATDPTVGWTSSDTNIATVDANGLVSAIIEGTTTITVTTVDGDFTDTSTITVEAIPIDVTGINVSPETATITNGSTQQLTATISPIDADDTSVSWISDDTSIASVDSNGLVTGVNGGTAIIRVTTNDGGFSAEATITIIEPVTSVTVSPQTLNLVLGDTAMLTEDVRPLDATDPSVTWSTSNSNIATVDSSGIVTTRAIGNVTVTVTTNDGGFTDQTNISIVEPIVNVTGVTLNPGSVSINPGDTTVLSAQVSPSDASDTSISWTSSDTNIATVDSGGLVTAIAVGDAVITVTTNDGGFTAQSNITIVEPIVDVTGVTLNPDSITINPGDTTVLSAQVSPSDASDTSVTWTSSDTAIATVDSGGLVTAIAVGSAIITVTTNDGGFTAQSNITVVEPIVDVTGVTLNPDSVTINPGDTTVLAAQVSPSDASDTSVSWASSDTAIATVDSGGLVTAIAVGSAIITVTTNDGGFTAQSNITVVEPIVDVTGVTLNPDSVTINPGDTTVLAAQVSPSNASDTSVSWASSDTAVATVDSGGLVTAIAVGDAVITVTTNDGGFTAQSNVSVVEENNQDCSATGSITMRRYDNIAGISLTNLFNAPIFPDSPTTTLELDSFEIPAYVANNYGAWVNGFLCAPETGIYYFWISGDDHVRLNLSTDNNAGNKTTVAFHNGHTNYRMWDRYDSQKSIGIQLEQGQSYYIEAFLKEGVGGDHLSVGWRKPSDGQGEAPSEIIPGSVLSPNQDIPYQIAVTGVSVDRTNVVLLEGDSTTITAQVSPSNASDTSVNWTSSDTDIATVDSGGLVTAIAVGNAVITVTTNDGGFTAQANVSVVGATVDVTGISVDPDSASLNPEGTTILTAQVSPSNASDTSVTWASSDTDIATVDSGGLVTAIAVGDAVITVTTNDGGFTAQSNITIVEPIVDVTGVTLNPNSVSINPGDTTVLAAQISPSDASDTSVTWTSSDTAVATVDSGGLVTAIAVGNTVITVTTNDSGFTAQSDISVVENNNQDCSATGSITMRRYDNILGISLTNLFNAASFPDNPTTTLELDSFEIPAYVANNYGAWVNGFLCAPETGIYYFWISGDDHVRLNLSTDNNAGNKTTIAFHSGHTNYRMWDRYDSQKSIGIQLEQGQSYYIEGFLKEGVGGDHLSVGWRKPSDGQGEAPSEIIPGSVLSPNQDIPYQIAVTGVSVDRTNVTLLEGNSTMISSQVSPSNAANQNVTWQSSDNSIATVDSNGLVNALAVGNTIITVTTNDGGFTAQSNITVREENNQDCTATGTIIMRRYDDIGGITLNDLFVASNFPDNPSSTSELNSFEIPKHVADNYGAWVSGYLCAPETGTYYFWVSGDNHVQLNLSADDDMANIATIAYHNGHTNTRIWNKYASQRSVGIELEQGQSYYIEAYLKELNGGDHLAVGWSKPSDASSDLPSEVIPGGVLSPNLAQSFPLQASLSDFIDVTIVNIYPNPTSEFINIEISGSKKIKSMNIFDSSGRTVMELTQNAFQESKNNVINVSHLATGVYTITIITDDFRKFDEKFILRR